jgi:hypothetical protein
LEVALADFLFNKDIFVFTDLVDGALDLALFLLLGFSFGIAGAQLITARPPQSQAQGVTLSVAPLETESH